MIRYYYVRKKLVYRMQDLSMYYFPFKYILNGSKKWNGISGDKNNAIFTYILLDEYVCTTASYNMYIAFGCYDLIHCNAILLSV